MGLEDWVRLTTPELALHFRYPRQPCVHPSRLRTSAEAISVETVASRRVFDYNPSPGPAVCIF
jgi:hypothetical protein